MGQTLLGVEGRRLPELLSSAGPGGSPPTQPPSTSLLTGVQTLNDGGGIDEVPPADHAHKVGVELSDLEAGGAVHLGRTWKTHTRPGGELESGGQREKRSGGARRGKAGGRE